MNRFRKYLLTAYSGDKCVRWIMRTKVVNTKWGYRNANDQNKTHFWMPPINIYRIQSHKRFLGIPYWKTLVKTTSYKVAKAVYDWMVREEENK